MCEPGSASMWESCKRLRVSSVMRYECGTLRSHSEQRRSRAAHDHSTSSRALDSAEERHDLQCTTTTGAHAHVSPTPLIYRSFHYGAMLGSRPAVAECANHRIPRARCHFKCAHRPRGPRTSREGAPGGDHGSCAQQHEREPCTAVSLCGLRC